MGFFSRRESKLVVLSVGAVAIVAVFSVVITAGVKNRKGLSSEAVEENLEVQGEGFNPGDLIIPKEFTQVWAQGWTPFREQKKTWEKEDIEPYLSDTKEVLLEVLEKQTVDTLKRNLSPSPSGKAKK